MGNESLARYLDCELACIRPIDARSKLAFDANAKCIGSLLVSEMLALPITAIVVVIDKPRCFGFARRAYPRTFAD